MYVCMCHVCMYVFVGCVCTGEYTHTRTFMQKISKDVAGLIVAGLKQNVAGLIVAGLKQNVAGLKKKDYHDVAGLTILLLFN
jgi:hypothetical protein